ncbi:hypothetical protein EV715DRAFT_211620 [Schizophyllum commune]
MTTTTSSSLPAWPSENARKSLTPSQHATVYQNVSAALSHVLALPHDKRDDDSVNRFISSYAKDAALQVLEGLVWNKDTSQDNVQKSVRKKVLALAESYSTTHGIDAQTLLDLAVAYGTNPSRISSIIAASIHSDASLLSSFRSEVAPAIVSLLTPASGLYGLRKMTHCLLCLLRASPPEVQRCCSQSKELLVAVAKVYNQVLPSLAQNYGGLSAFQSAAHREVDEWERIWLETKVALVDVFHILVSRMLEDLSSAKGQALGFEADRAFDIVFSIVEVPLASVPTSSLPATPFLNRSLLADYQQTYDLKKALAKSMHHAAERDARLDLLESSLQSLDGESKKDPGVLKILLRSSGIPLGIDNLGKGSRDKGKGRAQEAPPTVAQPVDPDLDLKVAQVLDIFPDHAPEYVRALLTHESYPYKGDPEKLIMALLDGTAPSEDQLEATAAPQPISRPPEVQAVVQERRNAFDDEVMNTAQLRVGKKKYVDDVLRDRDFISQMKADILRRAEAMDLEDDEEEDVEKAADAFEDDLEGLNQVKVAGDGEETDEEEDAAAPTPDTILELAYIKNPKLFERDGQTRRSKERAELKSKTGLDDEQIEGWRIMLERNPKKDKILAKHELTPNQNRLPPPAEASGSGQGDSQRGRGRGGGAGGRGRGGRGRGRGRGGGGGGGSGSTSSDPNTARDRAWKNKNKSSRATRGHDKKMARMAGPPQ